MGAAAIGTAKIVPALARITFGIREVRARRGRDDRIDASPVRAAQDRPDVAGLLDGLDDDDQRLGRQVQVSEPEGRCLDDGHEPLRSVTECHLGEGRLRGRGHRHAARLERVERRPRVFAGQQRLAHEGLDDLDARFEGPA